MKASRLIFGPFQLDPTEQCLWKGGERLAVAPKPFALLQHLARHPGHLATRDELLEAIWPDVHVCGAVLKTCIAELRQVLSDEADAPQFIETVQRRGYRFIAPVAVSNLPARLTSFIGRKRELLAVEGLLANFRLVTLVGPAGVGKTSLALRAASDLFPEVPHGVCWVDLTALSDPCLVGQTVAAALGIRDDARLPIVDILTDILDERRLLLVLDNCEHLIDAGASLVQSLMHACRQVKILATSREPLGLDGEITWLVPPLSVPNSSGSVDDVFACESGRLFVERATEAASSFLVTDENAAAIAEICRRLDGLPLAIELAAVRVKVLAPEQIAARLDDALGLLGRGTRTRHARHQTLAAAIDWSYELLSAKERLLLAILSVFAGDFTLAVAESVCTATREFDANELLDLFTGLVDRSLIAVIGLESVSEKRYRLLETIRQYARKKVPTRLEAKLAKAYAEVFACIAEDIEPFINSATRDACLARLDREASHFRTVLRWSQTDADGSLLGLRLAGALWLYWIHRGQWGEGRAWLEMMLQQDREVHEHPRVTAQALCGAGTLAICQDDEEAGRTRLEESVALWRRTNDLIGLGFALQLLGQVVARLGDLDRAEQLIRESVDVLRSAGSGWHLAVALNDLGILSRHQGQLDTAESFHEDAANIMRSIPDPWGLTMPLRHLGLIATLRGQYDRAEAHYRDALLALSPLEDRWFLALTLEGAAGVSCERGHKDRAARLLGAAEKLRDTIGAPLQKTQRADYDLMVSQLSTALGEVAFRSAWTAGKTLSRNEAITFAIDTQAVPA